MATLFRPVGLNELSLIWDMEFHGFPPRLPHQPYFYPVANADYARQLASGWNVKDEASGFAGFVTRFQLAEDFLSTLEPHVVGDKTHVEYWIPAEQLESFNHAITDGISVKEAFFGLEFAGYVPQEFNLRGKNAVEQFVVLGKALDYSPMDFICEVSANCKAVYLNSCFWAQHDFAAVGFDTVRKAKVIHHLCKAWARVVPNRPLLPSCGEDAEGTGAGKVE